MLPFAPLCIPFYSYLSSLVLSIITIVVIINEIIIIIITVVVFLYDGLLLFHSFHIIFIIQICILEKYIIHWSWSYVYYSFKLQKCYLLKKREFYNLDWLLSSYLGQGRRFIGLRQRCSVGAPGSKPIRGQRSYKMHWHHALHCCSFRLVFYFKL